MTRAFLGLGSNVGDRSAALRDAVRSLPGLVAVSDVYETEPVGGPAQDPYLNCVAQVDPEALGRGSPEQLAHRLLGLCRRLEAAAGRTREVRFGPRTLDVDVLWIDGVTVDDEELVVPHPRMMERRFVLAPLAELAPDLVPHDWRRRAHGRVERVGPLLRAQP